MISLLKKLAAEWGITYIDNEKYITFKKYENLQKKFIERFIDSNQSRTALAILLQLKQGHTRIQDYITKVLTLVSLVTFNRLLYKK